MLGVQTICVIMFYFGTSARRIPEVQSFLRPPLQQAVTELSSTVLVVGINHTIDMTEVFLTRLSEITYFKARLLTQDVL